MQDVWLRWHDAARDSIENAEAWLVAITTRTSIDRLRAAKLRREHYAGIWLPEPELGESPATPEEMTERANDVSVAYLLLLERLIGDGGGHIQSFPKPMVGGRRIAQLFYATWLRCGSGVEMRPVVLNGQWAMLRFIGGQLEAAMSFETDGTRIGRILVQRNPDKLARIATACAAG